MVFLLKILFVRSEKAYLPEVDAYIEYFNKTNDFLAFDSEKINKDYSLCDFDVIWEFKGLGRAITKDKIVVHEYASLSTGRMPYIKNRIKSLVNGKPDLRVFLNSEVKDGFHFNDNIDYCYRDMGISDEFINVQPSNKEFDFVYIGAISKTRHVDNLLRTFVKNKCGKICLIGTPEDEIYNTYKKYKDIIFTGRVQYSYVPGIASRSIYGLNYIPNIYPYNLQTSTKLLEYLALGLKVITTEYKWVNNFEIENRCSFYKLRNIDEDLDINKISSFSYINNFNTDNYTWKSIIDKSNIAKKIKQLYKGQGVYHD